MANPIDLEKLCQGAKVWNAWRAQNPDVIPDLTDANLTLSQRQFGPASGGPINLRGANLEGAVLRYATLSGADLEDAILVGADLVHARLDGANLTGADLTDAVCDNADFAEAKLDDAVLTGTSFANARNLVEDQIAFAHGNVSTLLPAAIMPPAGWFSTVEDTLYPEYPVPEQIVDEDLYEVLGVECTAKPEEIRSAFRNLVKKLHPDVNPDDEEAQEAFKKVSTAYRILSDTEKRQRYDKGEIGTDGEINPEFEAKRQFRRYAFRFYTAAAMSLLLAVGVLGMVWYAVLTDDGAGNGRVEIAVATPPKSSERLDSVRAELKVDFRKMPRMSVQESGETAVEAKTEIFAQPSPDEQNEGVEAQVTKTEGDAGQTVLMPFDAPGDLPNTEPAEDQSAAETFKQAALQTSPTAAELPESSATAMLPQSVILAPKSVPHTEQSASSNQPAATGQQVATAAQQAPLTEEESDSPSEPHSLVPSAPVTQNADGQAPVVARAQSAPPHNAKVTTRPLFEENKGEQARPAQADAARRGTSSTEIATAPSRGAAGIPFADRTQLARDQGFVRKTDGRKGATDAISALFGQRAVRQGLAQDPQQATASMDPLASREEFNGQDEIRDLYTHSLPDGGAAPEENWQGFPKAKESARREVRPASRDILAKVPARESRPAAPNRKQAVSDIFTGGL